MKCLSLAAIAILAGCSQETLDFAQTPVSAESEPQSETKAQPVGLSPQPKEPVPVVTDPKVITSPPPPPQEGAKPLETDPAETDPAETDPAETDPAETDPAETDPAETDPAETDPAEIVARKLISDDPKDNLEVLNKALQTWLASKGELPEKIGDLVGEQLLPMLPMAPQGKIFEIDREANRVVLVAEK